MGHLYGWSCLFAQRSGETRLDHHSGSAHYLPEDALHRLFPVRFHRYLHETFNTFLVRSRLPNTDDEKGVRPSGKHCRSLVHKCVHRRSLDLRSDGEALASDNARRLHRCLQILLWSSGTKHSDGRHYPHHAGEGNLDVASLEAAEDIAHGDLYAWSTVC